MPGRPGGLTDVAPVTDDVRALVESVRGDIETKAGTSFDHFEPTYFSRQVVAGINYFVKINVGNGQSVHVRIYQDLSKHVSVHSVKTGLQEGDELVYF